MSEVFDAMDHTTRYQLARVLSLGKVEHKRGAWSSGAVEKAFDFLLEKELVSVKTSPARRKYTYTVTAAGESLRQLVKQWMQEKQDANKAEQDRIAADERLRCAAPDLLAALQVVTERLLAKCDVGDYTSDRDAEALNLSATAIAKATQ